MPATQTKDGTATDDHAAPAPAPPVQPRPHPRDVGAILTLVAVGGVLLWLALLVARQPGFPIDVAITRALQSVRQPVYGWILTHVSDLGYSPLSPLTFVAVFGLLVAMRLRREAIVAVAAALLAGLSDGLLKALTARPRPSAALVHVWNHPGDYSFPSGHVVHYTVLFGFACYALLHLAHREGTQPSRSYGSRARTWAALALAVVLAALVVLVGPSRVYLGAHWPTDVLGGYLLGGLWLAGAVRVASCQLPVASCQKIGASRGHGPPIYSVSEKESD